MRTSVLLSVLLGAGAIAHPHYKLNNPLVHHHHHHKRQDPIVAVDYLKNAQGQVTEVVDIAEAVSTICIGCATAPTPAAAANPNEAGAEVHVNADYHVAAQANSHSNGNEQAAPQHQQPKEAEKPSTPALAPAPVPAPKPAPAPAPAPSPVVVNPAPSSGGSGATIGGQNVVDVANKWRSKQGLGTFTWDDGLAGVSASTNSANGANSMTHHNVPPSLGQVIAQGSSTLTGPSSQGELGPMDLLYLGWICELGDEIPDFPCSDATAATHMNTQGQTDHAQILMNPQYTKLGCNFLDATDPASQVFPDVYQGMLTCDVS
ncbi:MAG: hypothetical protein ASARMPRED_000455 [Alectoria sarmentosa]|nr:MAG: hypothetical protein ASARMPRED_000455 [Alectoria sarmentosa]